MYFNLKSLAVVIFSSFFLITSCKKKVGDNEKIDRPNDPVSDFMSTEEGSWWLYGSLDGTVIKRYATGKDSLKEGLVFNYYETVDTNTGNITPEYFALNEDKYIMLIDLDGEKTTYMPAIVQKENSQVGDEWSNTKSLSYSGLPVDILIEGKVVAINQTVEVSGTIFSNVTEVENILKAKTSVSPYTKCGTVRMWFSKGIGVVKTDFDINVMGLFKRHYADSLIDYHIEQE